MRWEALARILNVAGIMLLALGVMMRNLPMLLVAAVVLMVRTMVNMRQ